MSHTLRAAKALTRPSSHRFLQPSPMAATHPPTAITTQTLHLNRPLTNTLIRRPIPNSYWATPNLLACEYPFSPSSPRPKLDALLAAGVRTFIDLTEPGELLNYAEHLPARAASLGVSPSTLSYHRFAIPDRCVPTSPLLLSRVMEVLRGCERKGQKVAIHCRGGIGRTGTIVGCWLVESGVARDGDDALRIIAQEWRTVDKCRRFPQSPETGPQFEFVRNFRRLQPMSPNSNPRQSSVIAMEAKW